jgi:nucleotide-binding universal stress UspA family protein
MSLRILVRLTGSAHDVSALNGAFAVAKLFDGEIDALFVRPDPRLAIEAVDSEGYATAFQALYDSIEAADLERSKSIRKTFEKWRDHNGLRAASNGDPSGVTAHWHDAMGSESAILVDKARVSDLTVMARPSNTLADRFDPTLEAALMLSGRPVLLVPPKTHATVHLSTVMVAWNNSAESARAVGAALPLLKAASRVKVFTAAEGQLEDTAAEHLISYLQSRGITASKQVDGTTESKPVHDQLLDSAKKAKADLVVMGAYSHNRVRELIFGGVTRHMLSESPVLTFIMH